jgi:hypothetical protein
VGIERAALGCVLLATESQAEVDALLLQLRPNLFYDLRHRGICTELTRMRMEGHALDLVTFHSWLKGREAEFGGMAYLADLPNAPPSLQMFSEYLKQLKALARRRWALAESVRLAERARNGDLDLADLRAEFSEALEKVEGDSRRETSLIETVTLAEIQAYVEDPSNFLVGDGIITRGEPMVIGGWPGLGKSTLLNTLAFAGARGRGTWQGYEVKRRFRTYILQSEAGMGRFSKEFKDIPKEAGDWVRFSKKCSLSFGRPEFRQTLRREWERWPFDVLGIDHWADVAREEGQADYLTALENIYAALPSGDAQPTLAVVAHLRKQRGGEFWRPKSGRQLLDELSGSFVIGAKARTVFVLQPVTMELSDTRIVFDCAKCSNAIPHDRSAWDRCAGEFQPLDHFDFEAWLNPPEEGARAHKPKREDWEAIFSGGPAGMTKKTLADRLMQDRHCATASAYRWIDEAVKAGLLYESADIIAWKGQA